jgi:phosphoenolpyruvate carboxykinase (ATP)
VNTGWSGGPFGIGQRMKLPHTRAILTAALSGALDEVAYRPHPVFRGGIPAACPGVPVELLDPRNTWKDAAAYDRKAAELAGLFSRNFEKFAGASAEVRAAGPSA